MALDIGFITAKDNMMRRLWIDLTIAFTLVTLLSVGAAALLANQQASTDVRRFVMQNQLQESGLTADLVAYYQQHGNWGGVEQVFANYRSGMGGHGMMHGAATMALTDSTNQVVYDSRGTTAQAAPLSNPISMPIMAGDTLIGTLQTTPAGGMGMNASSQRFLTQINQSLLQAAIVGALLGAFSGLLLARRLAAPLSQLATAARQIAQGDHSQRLAVGGPLEVASASRAFNEMADALAEGEALRQRMLSDIAHELRTPLAVIQGNLQAILDDVYPLDKREVQTIFDETVLLGHLVSDLRELTLADAGELRLQPQATAPDKLIAQAVAQFSAAASQKGVQLSATPEEALPAVWADPARINQVLHNLLANAIRYTPTGGAIRVQARPQDDTATIRIDVRNTGGGIAPADLPHVFERFWRADRSRSRAQGGSGLGLAIAQRIVQAHGGQIGVQSEPEQETCFWFTLPFAER